jgi:hypothetical protein
MVSQFKPQTLTLTIDDYESRSDPSCDAPINESQLLFRKPWSFDNQSRAFVEPVRSPLSDVISSADCQDSFQPYESNQPAYMSDYSSVDGRHRSNMEIIRAPRRLVGCANGINPCFSVPGNTHVGRRRTEGAAAGGTVPPSLAVEVSAIGKQARCVDTGTWIRDG